MQNDSQDKIDVFVNFIKKVSQKANMLSNEKSSLELLKNLLTDELTSRTRNFFHGLYDTVQIDEILTDLARIQKKLKTYESKKSK